MESRLKTRISRMFRSSFGSCSTRKFSDVMEKAVFTPLDQNQPSVKLIEPISPKLRPFPSIFTPKPFHSSHSLLSTNEDSLYATPSLPAPASAIYQNQFALAEKLKKKNTTRKKKKNNAHMRIKHRDLIPFGYSTKDANFGGNWWYSSDEDDEGDDDEIETLFSSKSNSSDSSKSRLRRRRSRLRKCLGCGDWSSDMGVVPLQGKVKDTFAVVKRSSDPHNDFRTSMVEMIVEKHIFAPRDLENLLQCFLSLNSPHHHKIIVEVFTEIYDALFSGWL